MSKGQEKAIDEYLRSKGEDPQPNPAEGAGHGDRIISGVRTEYKTISGVLNPTDDKLSGAISNRAMNARSQAPSVVIDGRNQHGMTQAIAERGAVRAFNADKATASASRGSPKIESIRIIFKDASGNDTDILFLRK